MLETDRRGGEYALQAKRFCRESQISCDQLEAGPEGLGCRPLFSRLALAK